MSRAAPARASLVAAGFALSMSGCIGWLDARASYQADPQTLSLPSWVVFQSGAGALSYHAATGRDGHGWLPARRIEGRACQRGIQVPLLAALIPSGIDARHAQPSALSVGWGDGGYQAALDDARTRMPPGAILFDVQVDLHSRAILSIYREQCVVIDAGVLVPAPTADAPAL